MIDGAEFNNPSSDRVLGFPDVAKIYMIRSYHQPDESFEIIFNKGKYDGLPAELQAILKYASRGGSSADMLEGAGPLLEGSDGAAGAAASRSADAADGAGGAAPGLEQGDRAALEADPFFKKVDRQPEGLVQRVVFYDLYKSADTSSPTSTTSSRSPSERDGRAMNGDAAGRAGAPPRSC